MEYESTASSYNRRWMSDLKNHESENIRQILILRNTDSSFGLNLLFLGKIFETSWERFKWALHVFLRKLAYDINVSLSN